MPWSKEDYPDSMKNLPDDVRDKAIEIANAILEKDKKDESRAIAIGIAQARKYIEGADDDRPKYEVTADGDEWVLRKKDSEKVIKREKTKEALLPDAKEYVNEHDGILAIYTHGGSLSQTLYE